MLLSALEHEEHWEPQEHIRHSRRSLEHYFHSRSSQEKYQFPGVSWEQLGADALPEQNPKKKVVMIEEKEFFYSYFLYILLFLNHYYLYMVMCYIFVFTLETQINMLLP